jgi:hypothetical protein
MTLEQLMGNNAINTERPAVRSLKQSVQPTSLAYQMHWHRAGTANFTNIDIFINCNWVVTRWQYTFTHKQYTEQHK